MKEIYRNAFRDCKKLEESIAFGFRKINIFMW